jgi:hypothetical protein
MSLINNLPHDAVVARPLKRSVRLHIVSESRKSKNPCSCCGYLVFDEPPGSYAICPICFWEDDHVQLRFPTLEGGADKLSLTQSQGNFAAFGACEERFQKDVRRPKETDVKDLEWRMIDESMDRFEEPITDSGQFTPYPDDRTTLYYWRSTYWRNAI